MRQCKTLPQQPTMAGPKIGSLEPAQAMRRRRAVGYGSQPSAKWCHSGSKSFFGVTQRMVCSKALTSSEAADKLSGRYVAIVDGEG